MCSPRCMQSVCEWVMRYAVRDRCESCTGEMLCCMFIVPSLGCFVSPGIGLVYTTLAAAEQPRVYPPIPARLHSSSWCIREPGVLHMADTYQYRQLALITAQVPLFLSIMIRHSLKRTQANLLYLCENFIS